MVAGVGQCAGKLSVPGHPTDLDKIVGQGLSLLAVGSCGWVGLFGHVFSRLFSFSR